MTGRVIAAEGDAPVWAYIDSMPPPLRTIAKKIDSLAAEHVHGLKRAVKWGMAYYGVEEGWCFSSGASGDHLNLMFIRGSALDPEPPVTPVAMGKATRGVQLFTMNEIDDSPVVSWILQSLADPFPGASQRRKRR